VIGARPSLPAIARGAVSFVLLAALLTATLATSVCAQETCDCEWAQRPLAHLYPTLGRNLDNDAPEDDVTWVVVAGTVGESLGRPGGIFNDTGEELHQFIVEQWLPGPEAPALVPIVTSPFACSLELKRGDRIVLLSGFQSGQLSASVCLPHAMLSTPEADALLTEGIALFGPPAVPGQASSPVSDGAGTILPIALGVLVLTVIVVSVVLARSRGDEPQKG